MKKLLYTFVILVALSAATPAFAASRFWVGGTGTWDSTTKTHWAASSGGAGGQTVPGSGDTVTFDASSGGGTVTPNYNMTVTSITMGAFTGTLDFSANNNSPTMATFSGTGTGVRTLKMGSGTWTITGNNTTVWNDTTVTNFTLTPGSSTINLTYSGSTGTRTFTGGTAVINNLRVSAGSDTTAVTALIGGDLDFTGFSGASSNTAITVSGSVTLGSGMTVTTGTSVLTLTPSATQTFTSNGVTFNRPITINGTGGIQLADDLTMLSSRTLTLTAGTFDANNHDVSVGLFSSSGTGVRTITFGSGTWSVTGNNGTIWTTATLTNATVNLGNPVQLTYSGSTGTRTIQDGETAGGTEANAVSFSVTAGSDIVSFTNSDKVGSLDFTGFTGTLANTSPTVYGDLTFSTGMTETAGASATTMGATSGTQTVTTNGETLDFPITINGIGGTVELADDLTLGSARTLTLTNGTFDANNHNVSVGLFSSSNSNTRTLTMGSGTLSVTGNAGTVWTTATMTSATMSLSSPVQLTYSGSTGTRTITSGTTGGTEANALNFDITAGSDTVTFSTNDQVDTVDFTGFTGTLSNNTRTVYGDLTFSTGMTETAGASATTMGATSGTQTVTTNGETLDFPITINGIGGTVELADDLTLGSARTLTLTNGTFDANNHNVSVGLFSSSNSNTRTLTMGSGTWILSGTGTVWNAATVTGFTLEPDSSTIEMIDSSATTNTFAGGGLTYNNLWLSRGAGGATVTFTGSSTFNDFKDDGSAAHTITFTQSTTQTVGSWHVSGSAGNLITIGSSNTKTFALVKTGLGVVSADYLVIAHSVASPANTWYAGTHSTNNQGVSTAGSGWIFTAAPAGAPMVGAKHQLVGGFVRGAGGSVLLR